MFLAFPRPQKLEHTWNHIYETPANFAVILVHSACLIHLLFSQVSACLNFYFASCLASFHAHTYYHALVLLYNSFVNSRRPLLVLKVADFDVKASLSNKSEQLLHWLS